MHLDTNFLKRVLPEVEVLQGRLPQDITFSIDSRSITETQLFFALSGATVDGHTYVKQALTKGAGVVIAHSKKNILDSFLSEVSKEKLILLVADPLQAFISLAAAWRSEFSYPVAAVTGSVGKTSTKELTAHMLKLAGKKYLISQGNLNTIYGVPLMISCMSHEHEGALFEIGISKQGEMEEIVKMLRPTVALITCVAHSHMAGLGTVASIAHEKRMIFKYFLSDSIGIVNGDQPFLSAVSYAHPLVRFGLKTANQVQARKLKENVDGTLSFILKLYDHKYPITLTENHKGIIMNVLASVTLAHQLGVKDELIVESLKKLPIRKQRFQLCSLKGMRGTLIDDCYNASPESVKAALLALESMKTKGKKIAVLADMLELGHLSSFWHRQIGRFLRKVPSLDHLILVGQEVAWIEKTAPHFITIERVPSWQDAILYLSAKLDTDALVLVKGSRGMQLHHVVDEFVDKKTTSI